MNVRKPTAYEGNENYIFISYAHNDSEEVYRILNRLEEEGYRFWYDDGIAPGSEWPEDIAQHLNRSALCMAFITQNSVNSSNCRREINYALSKEKPFLSVILEQTEMSLGLEMQLSSQQSVIKYNFRTEEEFINKILSTAALESCRKPKPVPQPEPVPVAAEAAVRNETSASGISIEVESAKIDPSAAEAEGGSSAAAAGEVTNSSDNFAVRKKNKLPIIIGAAALALVFILFMVFGRPYKMSWGQSISKSEQYVSCHNQTITREDFKTIASLKKLRSISFDNCVFEDTSGITFVSGEVYSIVMEDCSGVNDYGFLNVPALEEMTVSGDPSFTELPQIDPSKLYHVDIRGSGVSDISMLADAPEIKELYIDSTPVKDISAVSSMPELSEFSCRGSKVTDLEPLAGLEELSELNISGCKVKLPGSLKTLYLQKLSCSGCGLSDLSLFKDQTQLTSLNISNNPEIKDLNWLNSHNYDTLTYMDLSGTGIDRKEMQVIHRCTKLTELRVQGMNGLGDLGFCAYLPELETIYAENSDIKDISGLKNCKKLKIIMLSFNDIEDISALSAITPSTDITDTVLDLSHNKIKDLSKLNTGKYHTILIAGNDKNAAATIPANVSGYHLVADWCEGITSTAFAKADSFDYIYLIGVPPDEKIATEDAFGSYRLKNVTEKEIAEMLKNGKLDYTFYDADFGYAASLYK